MKNETAVIAQHIVFWEPAAIGVRKKETQR
jgi:hypothetical protein